MTDLPAPELEDLLRRVGAMDDVEVLAVIRQKLKGLIPEL